MHKSGAMLQLKKEKQEEFETEPPDKDFHHPIVKRRRFKGPVYARLSTVFVGRFEQ